MLKLVKVSFLFNIYFLANIVPLAYLMAKSHGMTEIEKALEESLRDMEGVDFDKIISQAE